MRRHAEVIWRQVDGRVVGLDLRSSRYFSLNGSGAVLWEALEDDVAPEQLAEVLVGRYGIERSEADTDVAAFVKELSSNGLLEQ